MFLSMHSNGITVTLPVGCNDHALVLIWDEYVNGYGHSLAGVWCPSCNGTYLPVMGEDSAPWLERATVPLDYPADIGWN